MQSLKKQSNSDISHIPVALSDKVIGFTDKPVVQYHVPAVKNTSLGDYDNNDSIQILLSILSKLSLELILSIALLS